MVRGEAQALGLTVAAGVITFGTQQITVGEPMTGGLAIVIGLGLFYGYQLAEQHNHEDVYNDVVGQIGEENLKNLAEMGSERLKELSEKNSDSE